MDSLPGPEKPIDWGDLLKASKPETATAVTLRHKRVRPRQLIATMLHQSGWKGSDICKALGYTPGRLSVILNSRHPQLEQARAKFASEVADNIRDVQTRFKLYSNEMLDILVSHARRKAEDPALSRLAARDILHMAGFSPVKKQFLMTAEAPIEDLKRLATTIHEANEVVMSGKDWDISERKSA